MSDNIIDFKEGRFKHLLRIETARAKTECREFLETANLLPDGPDREVFLMLANRDPVEIAALTVRGQLLMETAERNPDDPEIVALTERLAEEQAQVVALRRAQATGSSPQPAVTRDGGLLRWTFAGFTGLMTYALTGSAWVGVLMFSAMLAVLQTLDSAPTLPLNPYLNVVRPIPDARR